MYKIICRTDINDFQNQIDEYAKKGYTLLVWEGWDSGSWSCVMTDSTDHPKIETKS